MPVGQAIFTGILSEMSNRRRPGHSPLGASQAVYLWLMEIFIDACDWDMVPNDYGMSPYADGGLIPIKPCINSSNSLRKMCDFSALSDLSPCFA
jgi:hypothetical protein